jgi:two-component system phosphate regulon response regulator PhoB
VAPAAARSHDNPEVALTFAPPADDVHDMAEQTLQEEWRPTVLVCDDEDVLRKLVHATLAPAGYHIAEACNGHEALALARTEAPALILLDLMMPGRSGSEVLAVLRREPATATTPVIVLSARAQAADRAALLDAGADAYLTKPFSPHALATLVAQLLDQRRERSAHAA